MKWNKYTIDTLTDAVDMVSAVLNDCGIEGIEIEDNVPLSPDDIKTMFVDFIPDLPPDDGRANVSFYLDADKDNTAVLKAVEAALLDTKSFMDIGSAQITQSTTEDKDWINNWKEFFHPFAVGDLVITPTWEEVPEEMKGHPVIHIDPGTAFGTGAHETTQLVIRQLQKYVKAGDEVLDVGCGSGILSVAAIILGAAHALGTDLDPNAVIATQENVEVNHLAEGSVEVIEGNIIDDKTIQDRAGYDKYDIVCANILADVLEPLSDEITRHMKPGALFITSGIIDTKEQEVVEKFRSNPELEIAEIHHNGEWVNVTARRVVQKAVV